MSNKQEPNWQPISNLPMISGMIDGQVTDAYNQYANLLEAREKPHVLDDYTLERVIKVFKEQQEFIWVYEKQLSIWKEKKLSVAQIDEITRLQSQVEKWNKALTDILALAEELKPVTIEKIMAKSDLELGIEFIEKLFK